jgi:hypothetical protein
MSAWPILAKEQYINGMRECVLNYTLLYVRNWVKLDSELRYEHVPKSVETGQVGKFTIL